MSRIGKKEIVLPAGVKVAINGKTVKVEGAKGKLEREIPEVITARLEGETLFIERGNDTQEASALHGLTRTLIANMVHGVSVGFVKTLEIQGVGYKVALKGKNLDFAIGVSHPVVMEPPVGIEFAVEGTQKIHVKGIDKELVGQVAANIRKLRKPEPYKGKGIRYAGERVILKAGKTGKK